MPARTLRRYLLLLLAFGILWRIVRYALAMPIWGDEASIGLNILNRSYADLLKPLDYVQVAPILFLWGERAAYEFLGMSELAMRLLPLLAGLLGLFLFHRWARLLVEPLPAAIATAIVAGSYYIVRHGTELKPYSFDFLAAMLLLLPAACFLKHRRNSSLILLLILLPVVLAMSYPAVFVGGAVGIALLLSIRKQAPISNILTLVYLLVLPAAFYFLLTHIGQSQYDRTASPMVAYWQDAFPPANPFKFLLWFIKIHVGNLFAYPIGGKNGASIASLFLFLVGLAALWRRTSMALKALLFAPFVLTFIAAVFRRYPYGESARVSQHLAPAICLLIAVGIAALIDRYAQTPVKRRQAIAAVFLSLLAVGLCGLAGNLIWPYKTKADRDARLAVRALVHEAKDSTVVVLQPASKIPVNFLWYLHERQSLPHFLAPFSEGSLNFPAESPASLWIVNTDESRSASLPALLESLLHRPLARQEIDHFQIGPRQYPPALWQVLYFPAPAATPSSTLAH